MVPPCYNTRCNMSGNTVKPQGKHPALRVAERRLKHFPATGQWGLSEAGRRDRNWHNACYVPSAALINYAIYAEQPTRQEDFRELFALSLGEPPRTSIALMSICTAKLRRHRPLQPCQSRHSLHCQRGGFTSNCRMDTLPVDQWRGCLSL